MIRHDLDSLPSYVPGARRADALKLSSNEVATPPLPSAAAAMAEAAAGANRYPDMGATALKEALAAQLRLPASRVAVGVGSSALCQQLVQITSTPDSEVIFPWRSFEAYPIFVQVVGATARPIPLLADGGHDLQGMLDAITERTSLIFVCNPNNPSGQTITVAQFEAFLDQVPENVLVAVDEAYVEFNRAADSPVATDYMDRPNVVGLRTFSKAYGLAGVRVGYAFGPEKVIAALDKVAIPFGVSSVAQAGALASLAAREELLARVEETVAVRDEVADAVGALRSQANFVWLPGVDSAAVAHALAQQGVLVRAFPEGVRITVTTRAEAKRLLDAWREAGL
ncbi:histidinol-phosphate transaminase [Corynebacterium uterequi]|uniref:Histidinol-phosphate aminotransferase n=1 Tax=Corynebacterium uterequi TaxID=1072256 RepID=A0A0G3H9W7_9CORY|nr:histidinol-phosphate transaminase [Corynebacterium uterequi]AKK10136.1 Putative phenylalanine aminotransferase [Corynebacterium uterequi]